MLLARAGHGVLLVDRARLPAEIPHGHFIHRHGPARLSRWGLLDRVLDSGCPAITSLTVDFGDFPLVGDELELDGVPVGLGPRRGPLDQILVDAAVEAGAELRDGFVVDDLLFSDGRVVGIEGRGADAPVRERARYVVGADGRNSRVAKRVRSPEYEAVPTLTVWYFSYWSGMVGDGLELYQRGRRIIFVFPTNDRLHAVFVGWPISALDTVRRDPERALLEVVDLVPELLERVRSGRREERMLGATRLPNFLRRPAGPGWALVGDAGCHKDPYLALGVCDAFRDAELLAGALDDELSGSRAEGDALAHYERRRNEATFADYRANLYQAQLNPPPRELLEARASVRGDREATRQFLLAGEGLLAQDANASLL
jgi:2-polyprenyl-6-methoxyphenol hydroxylase-like FAD-dependent oxidoreductase